MSSLAGEYGRLSFLDPGCQVINENLKNIIVGVGACDGFYLFLDVCNKKSYFLIFFLDFTYIVIDFNLEILGFLPSSISGF